MSQVKDLAEENEALKKQVEELSENLKGYEKDYDEIVNENDDLRSQLQAYQSEEEEKEESYEEEEAEEEEKVSMDEEEKSEDEEEEKSEDEDEEEKADAENDSEAQALEIAKALRSLGAEPVVTKTKAVELSKEEVFTQFAQITDSAERGRFYAKHRNKIFN